MQADSDCDEELRWVVLMSVIAIFRQLGARRTQETS